MSLKPQDVTLFGNIVFADVTNAGEVPLDEGGSSSNDSWPYRKSK